MTKIVKEHRVLEWLAIAGLLIAAALNAVNIYPLNVVFSVTAELIYILDSILAKRWPMLTLNIGLVLIYAVGVYYTLG